MSKRVELDTFEKRFETCANTFVVISMRPEKSLEFKENRILHQFF